MGHAEGLGHYGFGSGVLRQMKISVGPRLVRLVALFAVVGLVSACVAAPGASEGKVPPSGVGPPTSYPSPGSSCITQTSVVNAVESTMENLAKFSTAVVVGTFDGYGSAQWNTPNGERVATDADKRLGVWIYRPIKITPKSALRGVPSSVVGARVEGGAIGCDSNRFSNEPVLKEGGSYVFFLAPEWDPKHARSLDPWVLWAWPLNADGTVHTPLEGDVPISALSQVLADTPLLVLPTTTPPAAP